MSLPFDDDQLRAAYAPGKRRGPDCPTPDALLAAVRGEGVEAERLRVLDHALQCESCRSELALLHAVSDPGAAKAQRGSVLRRRAIPLALAATVLLAFGLARVFRPTDEILSERGGTSDVVLVSPANGNSVGDSVTFVWRPVTRALDYQLEVTDNEGTILSTTVTTDTTWRPGTPLPPGECRWWIIAHLDDRTERRSETWVLKAR